MAHTHTSSHHRNDTTEHAPRAHQRDSSGDAEERKSAAERSPDGEQGPSDDRMRRAEEMADRIGERIGHYASVAGLGILRFAARAREEIEDIWAEAQHIRRAKGS
jgi:hypothetical protein